MNTLSRSLSAGLKVCAASITALGTLFGTLAEAAVTNVAWYRLGENDPGAVSGAVVNSTTRDSVGTNHLSRLGSPTYTDAVSSDAANIASTLAVLFNGVNQACSRSIFTTVRDNFGIEAWVKTTATSEGTYFIAHNGNSTANGWGLIAVVGPPPLNAVAYRAEFGGGAVFGGGGSRAAGVWEHVALVRDNGTSTFYLNGVARGTTSTATPATPAGSFVLAAAPQVPPTGFFPGVIDEVRVFTFTPGQFSANDLLVNQPMVTTLAESGLAPGTATLNGSARSFGTATTVHFEWGISPNLNNITPDQALGSGFNTADFSEVLTALATGVSYSFRAVVTNGLGTAFGSTRTFTLGPTVTTLPASNLTQTSATLNGAVDPHGLETNASFEYGFTTDYGNVTPAQAVGNGHGQVTINHALTNLLPGVSYHFRAVASNSLGTTFGADQSFPDLAQVAYLKASATSPFAGFGRSVTMSGDTLVVAAGLGADVFVRQGNSWAQQRDLRVGRSVASVAISGDTLVIGDPIDDNAGINSGAAFVFVRNGTIWTQQALLRASNVSSGDNFGRSVAISGDTLVVGANFEDSNATGVNGDQSNNSAGQSGAAYVFVRNGTTWTQQAYLKASNTDPSDEFGITVGASGDAVVVGAHGEDSTATGVNGNETNNSASLSGAAYVFVRNGTTWTQQAYLKASNNATIGSQFAQFGLALAVSGDTIVVGAPGEDSASTGVNGDQANGNAFNSGAAYVFVRSGTTWSQQAYLKASNTEGGPSILDLGDLFGFSVAISGDSVVVGARREDSNATGVNGEGDNNLALESGAAYTFKRSGTAWSFQNYVKASNTAGGDEFGVSVAVSGDFVVVGADAEDSNAVGVNGDQLNNGAQNSGAAYVFGPPLPPKAEINVAQGIRTISDGGASDDYVVAGTNTQTRGFTIQNTGNGPLTGLGLTFDGPDASMFSLASNPTAPLAPAGTTNFAVRFTPTSTGIKTAALHIASNDEENNPFDITLRGESLSFTQDRDSDGLNDATEFQLASFGFDFQVSQTGLVNTLFNNLNGAVPNLNAVGFFTQSQLQALNVDARFISRDPATGLFKLGISLRKSTDLIQFQPFPFTAPGMTINAEGNLEFEFSVPGNAAFLRIEPE